MRRTFTLFLATLFALSIATTAFASSTAKSNFADEDGNEIPDEGEVVTGAYKSVYVYDADGDFAFDLGDGRVQTNDYYGSPEDPEAFFADAVADLDAETLTTCNYRNQYRGTFENDPFMDTGWIKNQINCKGYDDNGNYNYTIVHETDQRHTGDPDWAIWNDWEYHTYAVGGEGNLARPMNHSG